MEAIDFGEEWIWHKQINNRDCWVKRMDLYAKERKQFQRTHLKSEWKNMPTQYKGWYCGYVEINQSDNEMYKLAAEENTEAITHWFWNEGHNYFMAEVDYADYLFYLDSLYIGFTTLHPMIDQVPSVAIKQTKWMAQQLGEMEK